MRFSGICSGLALITLWPAAGLMAQKDAPIVLQNPSFEGTPTSGSSTLPFTLPGWHDCGPGNESPPDIQPNQFGVSMTPKHGNSYLGLVVRKKETWESVGQRLSRPLEKDQCYELSMDLCKSDHYVSPVSADSGAPTSNFVTPAKLIIWGGNGFCDKAEVLFETSVITHTRWLTYNFRLHPKKGNYSYIMFEAYYRTPVLFPYDGNILLDNASAIKPIECNPELMVAKERAKEKSKPGTAKGGASARPVDATKVDSPKVKPAETPVAATNMTKSLKKGRVYRLDKVYFDIDKYDVKPECEPQLEELFNYLANNPEVSIEIGGHTNNLLKVEKRAIELSTNRAKSVADWLINHGIQSSRITYVGYGWKYPIEPNTTPEGRRKNQRVEVKILGGF
ncbi:MAG: OmpA family protein [Saprospiraceae bacterium]|nr:OmpA family protein [Saprospiraceae bacterium]